MENDELLDNEELPFGLGCALDMFYAKDEVLATIKGLPLIFRDPAKVESDFQNFKKLLDDYQEQPHLLDAAIPDIIEECLLIVRTWLKTKRTEEILSLGLTENEVIQLKHLALKYLRHVFKVRGHKKVTQCMPHEINDFVPVLELLESVDLDDPTVTESSCVLIYWLSILVINPFDLKLFDNTPSSTLGKVKKSPSIAQRVLDMAMKCLVLNNIVGRATPTLIAKFLTRPDMLRRAPVSGSGPKIYDLGTFFSWCCLKMQQNQPFSVRLGAFASVASLLKQGKREDIIKYVRDILSATLDSKYGSDDTLIRKFGIKLIQRVGITCLKSKIAPWRYQRGARSLLANLQPDQVQTVTTDRIEPEIITADGEDQYKEVALFSREIEIVLDKLMKGLEDKDTIVRNSAAKGVGRVVNRLPKDYGNEVVGTVLKLLSERSKGGPWQGGCLALAELARRGLLLPERLEESLQKMKQALLYEEIRGNFSVGSFVRDAACYVMWAFARCFEADILQPFVNDIAIALVNIMVFDREVNCRRAAAAAFQENVGRVGSFPAGLEIIGFADYSSVGNRLNAFTKISKEIAAFPVYIRPMVDHLIQRKFNYFDPSIRELSAKALSNFARLDPEYLQAVIMDKLLPETISDNIATSHGAILCFSSVMVELSSIGRFPLELHTKAYEDIRNIVMVIIRDRLRPRGPRSETGHEYLRQALNHYIKCCAIAKLPFHDDQDVLDAWCSLLEENISYIDANVRTTAAETMPLFLTEFYYNVGKRERVGDIIKAFCENLSSPVFKTRAGYAHLFENMPVHLLKQAFSQVINDLVLCTMITSEEDKEWTECRRDATKALSNILSNKLVRDSDEEWAEGVPLDKLDFIIIWDQLITNMNDYTTDKRGDIGSWVREAAMTGIEKLMIGLRQYEVDYDMPLLSRTQYTYLLALICKQGVEKIDNLRVHAGKVLLSVLHSTPPVQIAHRDLLVEIFPKDLSATMNWRSSTESFPKFARLLSLPEYSQQILAGLVISGGSLTDTIQRDAQTALHGYVETCDRNEILRIGCILTDIFKCNQKVERMSIPLMKAWAQLLSAGVFFDVFKEVEQHFGLDLVECVKNEINKSSKVEKIMIGVQVLSELMQGTDEMMNLSLKRLLSLLCHPYPKVRVASAERTRAALDQYTSFKNGREASSLLSQLKLETTMEDCREIRKKICECLDISLLISPRVAAGSASAPKINPFLYL